MSEDPWGIADEIDDLVGGWTPEAEVPSEALDVDSEWLRKRMLALQFAAGDLAGLEAMFARERERLAEREEATVGSLRRTVEALTGQLTQAHRAMIWNAERAGVRPPVSVVTPWGALRSRQPQTPAVVVVHNQAGLVTWLFNQGRRDLVNFPEPKPSVPLTGLRELICDDMRLRVDGEEIPASLASVEVKGRTFTVEVE